MQRTAIKPKHRLSGWLLIGALVIAYPAHGDQGYRQDQRPAAETTERQIEAKQTGGKSPSSLAESDPASKLLALRQRVESVVQASRASIVRISTNSSPGSGVIVARSGMTVTVLTAAHVVRGSGEHDLPVIQTSDGQHHNSESIQISQWLDLATLTFSSSVPYQVVEIGDPAVGVVVIAGYPIDSNELAFVPALLTNSGSNLAGRAGGYAIGYSARLPSPQEWKWRVDTVRGMSGGPVLDLNGKLLAIHGEADRLPELNANGRMVGSSSGLGLGIPARAWLLAKNKLASYSKDDYLAMAQGQPLSIDDLVVQATSLSSKGDDKGALRIWDEIIRRDPADGSHYGNRALVHSAMDNERAALTDYNKAIELYPDSWQLYALRGATQSKLGDHKGAQADFKRSLSINKLYFRAVMLQMRDLVANNQAKEAVKIGASYLPTLESSSNGSFLIGNELIRAYAASGQGEKGLEFALKLAKLHPSEELIVIQISELYNNLDRTDDSLRYLRENLRRFPSSPQYVYRLAIMELDHGNPNTAASLLTKLISAKPDNSFLHAYQCYALTKAGKNEMAIASCKESIRLNPAFSLAYRYLGHAQSGIDQKAEAEASFSMALEHSSTKSAIDYLNRGEARWQLGKANVACLDYQQAFGKGVGNQDEARNSLKDWNQNFIAACKR